MGVYSVILHGGYVLEIGIIMIIIAKKRQSFFYEELVVASLGQSKYRILLNFMFYIEIN